MKEYPTFVFILCKEIMDKYSEEPEAVTRACVEMDQKVVINYYPKCPQPQPDMKPLLCSSKTGRVASGRQDHCQAYPGSFRSQSRRPHAFSEQCEVQERGPSGWG